jgi:hypothetical protein
MASIIYSINNQVAIPNAATSELCSFLLPAGTITAVRVKLKGGNVASNVVFNFSVNGTPLFTNELTLTTGTNEDEVTGLSTVATNDDFGVFSIDSMTSGGLASVTKISFHVTISDGAGAAYTVGGTDVAVTDGGTGRSTSTTAYALIAAGTTATGAHQTLAAGATTEVLVGGGASALPVWTTATGSGAPVRATSPALTTPDIGTPSAGDLVNCTMNVGNTDTTITRTGAGDIAVEGNAIYRAGGTDVAVADGGTGASTAAGARTNLDLNEATRTISAKTAAYTVVAATDHNKIFTNTGTAGNVTFTLPASAGCTAGKTRFSFYTLAAWSNRIEPDGSDHLYFYTTATAFDATTGNPAIGGTDLGTFMTVLYVGGGVWTVEACSDNWAV